MEGRNRKFRMEAALARAPHNCCCLRNNTAMRQLVQCIRDDLGSWDQGEDEVQVPITEESFIHCVLVDNRLD